MKIKNLLFTLFIIKSTQAIFDDPIVYTGHQCYSFVIVSRDELIKNYKECIDSLNLDIDRGYEDNQRTCGRVTCHSRNLGKRALYALSEGLFEECITKSETGAIWAEKDKMARFSVDIHFDKGNHLCW